MKIAYLTGEYPRATDTFIQREVAGLRALGFSVETCSIRRTDAQHLVGPEQRAEAAQTFYVLAAMNVWMLVRAHFGWLFRRPLAYFQALWLAIKAAPPGLRGMLFQMFYFAEAGVLAQYVRDQKIDHLHNHIAKASCTVAMLTSAISGIPYSFTLHGPDIFFEPKYWRLDAKIARAKFVACISHFCRAQAMIFAASSDVAKLRIIRCGIDPAMYEKSGPNDGQNILFVGRLDKVKGVPLLIGAMSEIAKTHPHARLTLIGDGPDRASLQAQTNAADLTDRVTFAGYKSQAEVADALRDCQVFALPSFAEGVPVVLMEAMAATRPVVTTYIAGIPELVSDGDSGILVRPSDQNTLTNALRDLLGNPDRCAKMGAIGRQKVITEFNISTEVAKLAALFNEAEN